MPADVSLTFVREVDVPKDYDWLGPRERDVLAGLANDKRRRDYCRGRWAATQALGPRYPNHAPSRIEVIANHQGAPDVFVDGQLSGAAISISHSADLAVCAVSPNDSALGCDIERIEPRSAAFVRDYFCESERARWQHAAHDTRPLLANLIWSAKESVLKALRIGLRRDTYSIEVHDIELGRPGWAAVRIRDRETHSEHAGWWTRRDDFVVTLVTAR